MIETPLPILYSFRRCPHAMQARLALAVGGIGCELPEVKLRAKPDPMQAAAITPFPRQFAAVDRQWFDAQPVSHLRAWLKGRLQSESLIAIMMVRGVLAGG